jgi:hypothetical protein
MLSMHAATGLSNTLSFDACRSNGDDRISSRRRVLRMRSTASSSRMSPSAGRHR